MIQNYKLLLHHVQNQKWFCKTPYFFQSSIVPKSCNSLIYIYIYTKILQIYRRYSREKVDPVGLLVDSCWIPRCNAPARCIVCMIENTSFSAMLNIAEPVSPPESVPIPFRLIVNIVSICPHLFVHVICPHFSLFSDEYMHVCFV